MTISPIYEVDIHMHDVGTIFRVAITDSGSPVNLSSGVSASNVLLMRKPDGTTASLPASFVTDGTDGLISYTVSGSDVLNQSGTWQLSASVNTITGKWTATAVGFTVKPTFVT